jgi:hypothetical protein
VISKSNSKIVRVSKLILMLSAGSLLFGLVACGPSESTRTSQLDQDKADNNETMRELQAAVGVYKGTLTGVNIDGQAVSNPVVVRVWIATTNSTNTGSSTSVDVPTLAGSIAIYSDATTFDLEGFNSGSFDPQSGYMTLYTTNGGSSDISSGQGIRAQLSSGTLTGLYNSPAQSMNITATLVSSLAKPTKVPSKPKAKQKDAK